MRNQQTTVFIILIGTVFLLSACKKIADIRVVDDVAYDAEFAIPLVNSKISLQDILDNEEDISILEIDENGNMTLNYEAEFEYNPINELLQEIPDFPLALLDSATTIPFQVFDNFDINSLSLKSGTLSFNLQSGIPENIDITITIPQLTKNGIPFSTNLDLVYLGSLPVTATIDPLSVQDYTLDLTGNTLQVNYAAITGSNNHVIIDLITGVAEDWNFDMAQGIFTQQTFPISQDSIEVDLFGNWLEGNISFEDPRIAIQIENSYGVPVAVQLKNVYAVTATGNVVSLTTSANNFEIDYPALNELGEVKTTTFYFDKNNSNIKEFLNTRPTKLYYEIEGMLNPDNTNEPGFITDQSNLASKLRLELPIYGAATGFTVETSSEIDLQDLEMISDAEFKIITDNGMPIDVSLQLYFQDENENIIDSLFTERQTLLSAANVDINGNTVNSSEVTTFIDVSKERMTMIQNARNILINASFSTLDHGNTSVRINSTQEVAVRMGAKIGLEN